jgi:hypothetical protein
MTEKQTGVVVAASLVVILSFATWLLSLHVIDFMKPGCREGYVPVFVVFSGWRCFPGYKPQ